MHAGILPVKNVARAKQRLAEVLGPRREPLVRSLVEDALDLVASSEALTWWVLTDDPWVRDQAAERGLRWAADPGTGLNDALREAIGTVMAEGAGSATILPSDTPLVTSGDLQDLLDTGATSDIVVVPERGRSGTNALYLAPPDAVPTRFGTGSLQAHIAAATDRHLRCTILDLPRVALDLDTWDDALEVLRRGRRHRSRTLDLLRDLAPEVDAHYLDQEVETPPPGSSS